MQNDLKFSGQNPVTINYNGSAEDIYAPVRTSSCDINIVSAQILDDLYSAKKNEICVRVKKGNTTIWEGYKMPNTYSQGVTLGLDNISMTCIDPVSILKYIKVNKLFQRPNIVTYKTLIGKALSFVMLDANKLWVERIVSYNGSYSGSNGLLDLNVQVSNFWDEDGESCSVYDMISEMLRPFCMTLVFYNQTYQIYCTNKTAGTRRFDKYTIATNGNLTLDSSNQSETKATGLYEFSSDEWKSNNVNTPSIDINTTYEKVTGIASTSIPSYSKMVYDLVDYSQRDQYEYEDLNVQRNKTKGYTSQYNIDSSDNWYYIWNGVYTNNEYGLNSKTGVNVNWYMNINKAKNYLDGSTGNPNDYGSILNFYGGAPNPTGTGKSQSTEKSVNVKRRITAYAADNGTPLEFLENSDLPWILDSHLDPNDGYTMDPEITMTSNNSKFGEAKNMQNSTRVVYNQLYEINLSANNENVIALNLTQSYSRTGIDTNIDIMQNNTFSNGLFNVQYINDDTGKRVPYIMSGNINYFPALWDAGNVKVNTVYFTRYKTSATLLRPSRVTPVWDKRMVYLYVVTGNNSVLQFNGKDWVSDTHRENGNAFYLKKMMNGETLYHTDFQYDLIETSDGSTYSLTDENYQYYLDEAGGVTEQHVSGGTDPFFPPYASEENTWYRWIDSCGIGKLSIKLPQIDLLNAQVYCEICNSTLLGSTGGNSTQPGPVAENVMYKIEGSGQYYDDDQGRYVTITMSNSNVDNYGDVRGFSAYVRYIPANATYVKGEHLDLDIQVTVPESNLGQMFDESDIQYELNSNQDYVEEFTGPSFRVNTYNPLVNSSFSYLIYNNTFADPDLFVVNSITGRPESYTVQAYFNWLSKIRKVYTKTLVPVAKTRPFANVRCYLKSPEVGTNELLVVKDSWDVKTNRHTVTAIEDNNLEVISVGTVDVLELPRRARAERWNLPTATRK